MITITINTVELTMDAKRGLIKMLRGLIESYSAGYTLVSQDDDSITLGEMDDQLYNNIDNSITEKEYNDLFQQDHKDQNDEVEKDTNERSDYYKSDRPVDP